MTWKFLAGIWFLLTLSIVGIWIAHGTNILTKDKVQIVSKRLNPTFGVEEEVIEWKQQFRLGLDYGAPAAVLCGVVGIVCLRVAYARAENFRHGEVR